ncbi:Ubiquitin thioesterase OTUB2 [Nibea albiflora]|uniref:Ubiquitin thioesterase OTUB2 n=1 Tax=Nibea albiflora TaxID=240163 RepID=A0ACB7FGK4_NIBAL|nr:Ubiquitin thioesterase OTUB2 [Nibea albiflora]
MQKTLVLKKQVELDEVNKQLALKRQEFKSYVEALARRRSELETKQQQTKERAMKFEKFVAENDVKRRRARKKFEDAREQNMLKRRELEDLTEQLKQLRASHRVLKERMAKYKIYEDYLMKTLDYLPSSYLDNGSDSLVMPIIRRHETLSITHKELLQRVRRLEEEVEQGQQQLQTMKQEHSVKKLMANKELSELQSELETLKEKNKQTEVNLMTQQSLSREKLVNVVQQCQADEQEDRLLQLFNEQATSDSVVQYLRLLTSAHLQNQADFFCHFVEAPNLLVYCHQEVEAMAMECDHVDILALSQALGICIHIVSMEGDDQQLAHHVIPEGAEPSLHLLYQTSHYNILYPRPQH